MTFPRPYRSGRISLLTMILITAGLSARLFAHPIPDIPVRAHFDKAGNMEVRIEIDPRAFEGDPEAFDYLTSEWIEEFADKEFAELQKKASLFIEQRLALHLLPGEEAKPTFTWHWRGLGDTELPDDKEAPVVLVGTWKTKLNSEATGYHISAKELDPFKMGIPLNVTFYNFIDGAKAKRYAVLFPGESSYVFDLTALGVGGGE